MASRKKGLATVGPDSSMGVFKYTHRIPYSKKMSNDGEWVEEMADYYDFYYSRDFYDERQAKLKINYDLYNGRAPDLNDYLNKHHTSRHNFHHNGEDHELVTGYEDIEHHPIIDQVAKAMMGEQRKRPLSPVAKDTSGYAMNQRKRKKLEMLQAWVDQSIMDPIRQETIQGYYQEMGIEDPSQLPPEQQEQAQADISQRIEARTPSEIKEYMIKDYRAPSEIQAQKIIDYLMVEFDIKDVTDDGAKHAIITGEEVYRVGVQNGKPFFELVNPIGFTYYGSPNSRYIEDGDWAKYEQTMTYHEFFNRFGMQLRPKDYKKLDVIFSGLSSDHNYSNAVQSDLVSVVSSTGEMEQPHPDIRSNEGQGFMKDIYQRYGSLSHYDLRHVHLTWKSLRKLWYVERFDQRSGLLKGYWQDETYVPDKRRGDVKWKSYWVPQVWECDKIGYIDSIYLNKRPLPGQYRSINDPFDVKLPYHGIEYNKLMRNTKNVSIIDLGKPWQYKFNVQMARLQELEATDLGKVLLTTMQAKPKDWGWQEFFNHIRYSKAVVLDLQQEGVGPAEAQFFKSIDLGNSNDIAEKVQYLEFIKQNIATSMYYNPSRLGQMSPDTAVTNNQQNIIQSSNQTEDFYSTHNTVVERMLNALLDAARFSHKENPDFLAHILDDMSKAELDTEEYPIHQSKVGVFLRNQSEDFQNMQKARDLLPFMIQNQMMSFPQAMKALWAKDGAEILNIAEKAEQDLQDKMEQQREAEQQAAAQQQEMQKQLFEMQAQLKVLLQDKSDTAKIEMARLSATVMERGQDVNQNQISDTLEKEREKMAHDTQEQDKTRAHEIDKLKEEIKMKEKELSSKERIENKKISAQKAKPATAGK